MRKLKNYRKEEGKGLILKQLITCVNSHPDLTLADYAKHFCANALSFWLSGETSSKRYAKESVEAVKWGSQTLAPFCSQSACKTAFFDMEIETFFAPALKPGQVVILENATFHKSAKTGKFIKGAGCTLLFPLPILLILPLALNSARALKRRSVF